MKGKEKAKKMNFKNSRDIKRTVTKVNYKNTGNKVEKKWSVEKCE